MKIEKLKTVRSSGGRPSGELGLEIVIRKINEIIDALEGSNGGGGNTNPDLVITVPRKTPQESDLISKKEVIKMIEDKVLELAGDNTDLCENSQLFKNKALIMLVNLKSKLESLK